MIKRLIALFAQIGAGLFIKWLFNDATIIVHILLITSVITGLSLLYEPINEFCFVVRDTKLRNERKRQIKEAKHARKIRKLGETEKCLKEKSDANTANLKPKNQTQEK